MTVAARATGPFAIDEAGDEDVIRCAASALPGGAGAGSFEAVATAEAASNAAQEKYARKYLAALLRGTMGI